MKPYRKGQRIILRAAKGSPPFRYEELERGFAGEGAKKLTFEIPHAGADCPLCRLERSVTFATCRTRLAQRTALDAIVPLHHA